MGTQFDAFISYRHSELDSKIAKRIHTQLERFRIPKTIREATGRKRINRIFRDKEELPLSVNLSDDIMEALKSSEYLIVICSPRTKESLWVQREIELFLSYHGRERVLIVLAEGEPRDVVPGILLEGQEPLCCDFRMPLYKAKTVELPRLAAAILGCRYDDLRQRQKQYRRRLITAGLSVTLAASVALAVYFYQTSRQIQANYEQALMNQSKFLSTESQRLLAEGDRLAAIELAMEALPQAEEDRPWVPEAEYALSQAVGAYVSEAKMQARASFGHNGTVLGFFLGAADDHLVSWDDTNYIYVWDIKTMALQRTIPTGTYLSVCKVIQMPEHRILVVESQRASCYDYLTGERTWVWEDENAVSLTGAVAHDNTALFLVYDETVCVLYPETGEELGRMALGLSFYDEHTWINFGSKEYSYADPIAFSPDCNWFALRYRRDDNRYGVLMGNFYTAAVSLSQMDFYYLETLLFTEDNKLVIAGQKDAHAVSTSSHKASILVEDWTDIACIDPETGETLWSAQVPHALPTVQVFLNRVECPDESGISCNAISCSAGNTCTVFDIQTGALLRTVPLPDSVVSAEWSGGQISWVLRNGQGAYYNFSRERTYVFRYFPEDLTWAVIDRGCYVLPENSTRILDYEYQADRNWTAFDGTENIQDMGFTDTCGKYMVLTDYGEDIMWCYDLETERLLWQQTLPENMYCQGIDSTGRFMIGFINSFEQGYDIVRIRLDTGEITFLPKQKNAAQQSVSPDLCNDRIVYHFTTQTPGTEETLYHLCIMDPETGEEEIIPLPAGCVARFAVADPGGRWLLLGNNTTSGAYMNLLDMETKKVTKLDGTPDLVSGGIEYAWNDRGSLLAAIGVDCVYVWNTQGTQLLALSTQGRLAESVRFMPGSEELLVLYSNGELCGYSLDGTQLHRTEITFEERIYKEPVDWYFGDSSFGVRVDSDFSLIDIQNWTAYAYVPNFLHYDLEQEKLYVFALNGEGTGYIAAWYPRYTLPALMERGRDILGDNTLTHEQREKYGIE